LTESSETVADDPRAEYTRRRDAARLARERLDRREALVGNARVVVFLAGLITLYLVFLPRLLHVVWLAIPFILFAGLLQIYERIKRGMVRAERLAGYYDKGLARLDERWAGTGEAGSSFVTENHPYALDLDLFGSGSMFERLCTARTQAGARMLADWLKAPAEPAEIRSRQEALNDLRQRLDLRAELSMLGADVPAGVDLDGLVRWGAEPPVLYAPKTRVLASCLVSLGILLLVLWALGDVSIAAYLIVLLLQSSLALRLKKRVEQVIRPVDRRARDLAVFAGLLARIENERFSSSRLCSIQAALSTAGSRPSQRIRKLVRLVDWLGATHNPYIGLVAELTLWTTQLAFAFDVWRREAGPQIGRWLDAVAQFEALSSLAGYAYENPSDPFPEIAGEGPLYDGEALGHPLIPRERCIRNDIRLGGDLHVLVVSGSNMSGKSTLLRTVGINAVLALAGAPIRGRRLRLSALALGATLRIQDSLQAGQSRFYAEIKRVRQLVDIARGPVPLLFLLDEIFHGTNSHDRRQGAEAVVRGLIKLGALGLVTTHDLALTQIVDQLAPMATNVHFEDRFENGSILFDYRMRPGVVEHSNALALMRAVGLEV
jgi:hypothetical protein